MSNGETALSYAMSLAHATATSNIRRTPDQIIEEAEKYRDFLDESEPEEVLSVFVLTSATYNEDDYDEVCGHMVGIYATREAAESYRDNAIPPVTDGVITEWGVHDMVVGPDGKYLPIGDGK